MLYLNEKNLEEIGVYYKETLKVIEKATSVLNESDYSQPIKPYLRYRDLTNRIIAMPAFIGGDINKAGIKWIASFPNNINIGKKRASSVVVLNNADTGELDAIVNGAYLSVIRTASVSALMMKKYIEVKKMDSYNVGIIGCGPIGIAHIKMTLELLGDKLKTLSVYDLNEETAKKVSELSNKIVVKNSWQEVYVDQDIFITCTVSKERYIDLEPKQGSLILNVSLRDFCENTYEFFKDCLVVDNFEEVNRENTDIENYVLKNGLKREQVLEIQEAITRNKIVSYIEENKTVMFSPMGMAIYDIAIAAYFKESAEKNHVGLLLN